MSLNKLLIVPADTLIEADRGFSYQTSLVDILARIKRKLIPSGYTYDAELQFYADIPEVLGPDNVFVFGRLLQHFYEKNIPATCAYPSCHGTPGATLVNENDIDLVLGRVDAVFVSTRAGVRRDMVIKKARSKNIPTALFDFKDHQSNYGSTDIQRDLCYGFKKGEHYDIYFKKDLPLGFKTEAILPLAPAPIRPESYRFPVLPKDINIFFSGRNVSGRVKCQSDRGEVLESVRRNFKDAAILEFDGRQKFMTAKKYWEYMSRARIALSPSGFVWDNFRYCEAGLAPGTALVAPRPYVETAGPAFMDGENAILYDTEFRDGKYHLKNGDELVDKVRYYLSNPAKLEAMADAWAKDVRSGHTVLARSKYIIESIERIL